MLLHYITLHMSLFDVLFITQGGPPYSHQCCHTCGNMGGVC